MQQCIVSGEAGAARAVLHFKMERCSRVLPASWLCLQCSELLCGLQSHVRIAFASEVGYGRQKVRLARISHTDAAHQRSHAVRRCMRSAWTLSQVLMFAGGFKLRALNTAWMSAFRGRTLLPDALDTRYQGCQVPLKGIRNETTPSSCCQLDGGGTDCARLGMSD